jgi:hypothetical protein
MQKSATNGQFRAVLVGAGTVGSASDDKSFHHVANGRDGCTLVPLSRPERKFQFMREMLYATFAPT